MTDIFRQCSEVGRTQLHQRSKKTELWALPLKSLEASLFWNSSRHRSHSMNVDFLLVHQFVGIFFCCSFGLIKASSGFCFWHLYLLLFTVKSCHVCRFSCVKLMLTVISASFCYERCCFCPMSRGSAVAHLDTLVEKINI